MTDDGAVVDWKARIAEMVYIRQAIADADEKGLWEHRLPAQAATDEQIAAVECDLGFDLDKSYRHFLLHANGWPAFYQAVDLFGTDDLMGAPRFEQASRLLADLEPGVLQRAGVDRRAVLPIAASQYDLDLFVLTGQEDSRPAEVIWFAGDEIDRFPSFDEYFLAMEDYNRMEVQALKASSS